MKSIQSWFEEYGVSHQNKTNKLIHWVCVPSIFFSIYGLFFAIPSWSENPRYLNYGNIILVGVLMFYFRLSPKLGVGMLLYSIAVVVLTNYFNEVIPMDYWLFSLIIFVLAWIGQFVGHHIEGAKPSFFKDLQFLLIGPAWVIAFIYRKFGINY